MQRLLTMTNVEVYSCFLQCSFPHFRTDTHRIAEPRGVPAESGTDRAQRYAQEHEEEMVNRGLQPGRCPSAALPYRPRPTPHPPTKTFTTNTVTPTTRTASHHTHDLLANSTQQELSNLPRASPADLQRQRDWEQSGRGGGANAAIEGDAPAAGDGMQVS
jgi:hypothetical protein